MALSRRWSDSHDDFSQTAEEHGAATALSLGALDEGEVIGELPKVWFGNLTINCAGLPVGNGDHPPTLQPVGATLISL
jgi:hypothetical protein